MKIALLKPNAAYSKEHSALLISHSFYYRWITRYPPLGLLYYAAILERSGHEVMIVDAEMEKLAINDVLERLRIFKPDLLAASINFYNTKDELGQLSYLKENLKNLKIVARGHYPNVYPIETIKHKCVDFVFTRKGYNTINELAAALEQGRDLYGVRGIVFKKNGETMRTRNEPPITDLNSLPFPARHLIRNDIYSNPLTIRHNFTMALGSIGCPYHCTYCVDNNTAHSVRSPSNIVDEMAFCQSHFNINEISFQDPTFTIGRRRIVDLCNELLVRKLKINWTIKTRCDLVDNELLKLMKQAGCVRISYGIESGDQQVLDNVRRDMKIERIREAIEYTLKHNILCVGFFIIGNKGDTRDTIEKTSRFARELRLDFAHFSIAEPLPQTETVKSSKKALEKDIWLEYSRGVKLTKKDFKSFDNELSTVELDRQIRKSYLTFYSNPRFFFRRTFSLNSYRYALSILKLFFIYIKIQCRKKGGV